jgi:hypothetical protein
MLAFISVVLIALGGYIFSYAFRKGGKVVAAVIVGGALIALGFAVFPSDYDPPGLPDNARR